MQQAIRPLGCSIGQVLSREGFYWCYTKHQKMTDKERNKENKGKCKKTKENIKI